MWWVLVGEKLISKNRYLQLFTKSNPNINITLYIKIFGIIFDEIKIENESKATLTVHRLQVCKWSQEVINSREAQL